MDGDSGWYLTFTQFLLVQWKQLLVGGLVAIFGIFRIFPLILGCFLIIPTDELIFFRGVAQAPTSIGPEWFLEDFCSSLNAGLTSTSHLRSEPMSNNSLPFWVKKRSPIEPLPLHPFGFAFVLNPDLDFPWDSEITGAHLLVLGWLP